VARGAESPRHHLAVRFVARQVDPGQQVRHASRHRQRAARIE
jgi:hypothetical protein